MSSEIAFALKDCTPLNTTNMEHLSLDDSDPTISIMSLINEVDLLIGDYKDIKGAPKEVEETLQDITYMSQTVSYLSTLFSDNTPDAKHILHLSPPAITLLHSIITPLSHDLHLAHKTLHKWPSPPTVWSIISFGLAHTSTIKTFQSQLTEHQLSFTSFLSESTFLPERNLEAPISPSSPVVTVTCPEEEWKRRSSIGVEIEHEESRGEEEVWKKLGKRLRGLPCSLRLRLLIEALSEIKVLAAAGGELLKGFEADVGKILELVVELDGRLLKEQHFSRDARIELHTVIDLEVKMLLHELRLIPDLMAQGLFHHSASPSSSPPTSSTIPPAVSTSPPRASFLPSQLSLALDSITYDSLPLHQFLQDHSAILMMILTLVAGARNTEKDPRHVEGGTRVHESFEEAGAAVLGRLAGHSGGVNSWCEVRRHLC